MYLEGLGFRSIGRILDVSNVTVLYWVREFGHILKKHVEKELPNDIHDIEVIEIDEMWHFTQKKVASSGFGLLSKGQPRESSAFQLAVVVEKPSSLS